MYSSGAHTCRGQIKPGHTGNNLIIFTCFLRLAATLSAVTHQRAHTCPTCSFARALSLCSSFP